MLIRQASSKIDLKRFISFPQALYRGDPYWAPPLWMDEMGAYSPRKNAILGHSDYTLLLAEDDSSVLGRSLVYVDRNFNAFYRTKMGFFGAFECVNDLSVAAALDEATVAWLRERGMTTVRGPIHPISESWGFLSDGFQAPPVFMAPYNPPHYNEFMVHLGYSKAKDLIAYEASQDRGYKIPRRFSDFADRLLARNPSLNVRRISMRDLSRDADSIMEISNIALKDNWGYVPLERDEFQEMLRRLRPIADPDAVWFVEDEGRPVGFTIGFPDINMILRKVDGHLFPVGFVRFLFEVKRLPDYRLFALAVLPKYQGKGLDVLLYVQIYRALSPKIRRLEANYILEDNHRIKNALEKLALDKVKTYRIYEKAISPVR
ncbi:MAG TPA: GNAT family N-acetyltransferase [Spirochaetia bacterium]|nr:GNAT family N-acetyltransferase [Spirochaetia bacterium]